MSPMSRVEVVVRQLKQLIIPKSREQSTLVRLPLELILPIVQDLPGSGKKALSRTCHRFYKCSGSWYQESLLTDEDRYEYLCMLERDGKLAGATCMGCKTTHKKHLFQKDELKNTPSLRYCLETKPMFWVCPSHILSFRDAQALSREVGEKIFVVQCQDCLHPVAEGHGYHHLPGDPSLMSVNGYGILTTYNGNIPSRGKIRSVLMELNLPICPHTQLGNHEVASLYDPQNYFTNKTVVIRRCQQKMCSTRYYFRYPGKHKKYCATNTLGFAFYRDLGPLQNVNDPLWANQLIKPELTKLKLQSELAKLRRKAIEEQERNGVDKNNPVDLRRDNVLLEARESLCSPFQSTSNLLKNIVMRRKINNHLNRRIRNDETVDNFVERIERYASMNK